MIKEKCRESIKIKLSDRELLTKYKLCQEETYSSVIRRIIKFIEDNNFHESK